ncbi:hypothetical protein DXT68_13290 [Microbacterium foliorum]|nr:hypothetical protein DXT68_13290 [Microbacterium foliorum]
MSRAATRDRGTGLETGPLPGMFPQASAVLRSPFALMPLWILAAGVLYLLGWSDLLTPLRADTGLFLGVVAVAFAILAQRHPGDQQPRSALPLNSGAVALITAYFIGAYVKNGGVPILQLLSGAEYDVYAFGIDGLHIAMLCFTGYYGVRAFRVFLDTRRLRDLAVFGWVIVLLATIANRSAVSFLVVACMIVYLRVRRLSATWIVMLVVVGVVFVYGFGVFGDLRLAHQIEAATGVPAARDAVLRFSRASEGFVASGLSPSWLWSYTYFTTPVANLNAAFGHAAGQLCSQTCGLPTVVLYDFIPDVIGERLGGVLGVEDFDKSVFLVAPDVTASTLFGSAVGAAGLVGGLGMACVLAVVAIVALRLLAGSRLYVEGVALLGTIIFFSFFENMVAYTSLFGQLVIVVVRAQLDLWSERRSGSLRSSTRAFVWLPERG